MKHHSSSSPYPHSSQSRPTTPSPSSPPLPPATSSGYFPRTTSLTNNTGGIWGVGGGGGSGTGTPVGSRPGTASSVYTTNTMTTTTTATPMGSTTSIISPAPISFPMSPPSTEPSPSPSYAPLPTNSPFTYSSPLPMSPNPNSNPIPTPGYTPKVSFDTFEDPSSSMFSYTLRVKSSNYLRSKGTRVFLCAASDDESGKKALDWACEDLVQDGDELIVYRGIEEAELQKDHDLVRDEARDLMRHIQEKCVEYDADRKLSIMVEFIAGKIPSTLDRLIALYRPDSLVVGTRGQRGLVAWSAGMGGLMGVGGAVGSVSKYCLSHSPVPVIVVRPESKVKKSREKRRADPKRGRHFDGLPATPLSPAPTRT
ncbi:hypothetical protein JAAARDRAFT_36235 [Jaapia argillacea MUCL 33604]|uniref:UspA domain-containing protein n=1 Tax=Jaapia argillacea MUCL 33604 TaxID=933084 RepID=A0A067PPN2_9AGAM|nr:hypothetical protein JAAARDRAFT_36235 [Jaapia argillacea MUCL 33604]